MLQQDVISAEGELSPFGSKKESHRKKVFGLLGEVLLLALFTTVLSISGQITYDYARYSTFFVNGMSMYPTLNQNVYRVVDATGQVENESNSPVYSWGNFDKSAYTYYCDYGMFDTKGFSLKALQRFDILVTYFKGDMVLGNDGHYRVKTKASNGVDPDLKIKRFIAGPGETFRFDTEGDLYVKTGGVFTLQEQPFLEAGIALDPNWKKDTLSGSWAAPDWASAEGKTLGENEYFVCGDNRLRNASYDSRSPENGAVPGEAIQGRAVTLIGRCSFHYYSNGTSEYHPIWNAYQMPWQLEWL